MQVNVSGAEWVMGSKPQSPFGGGSYLSSGATALSGVVEEVAETPLYAMDPGVPCSAQVCTAPKADSGLVLAHLGDLEKEQGASFEGCLSYQL